VLHSCNSVLGQSGSPLLSFDKGEPQIIGIVAKSNNQQPMRSIALLSPPLRQQFRGLLDTADS
jgi:hypothetical protein